MRARPAAEIEKETQLPSETGRCPGTPCSASDFDCCEGNGSLWGMPGETIYPEIQVFANKENAEYVRNYLESQRPELRSHPMILHKSDLSPTDLSRVKLLPHPNEGSVESHRLASCKEAAYDPHAQ